MRPAPGCLLLAEPALQDPNFRRTVILLCDHNDEGSFGLVLTRSLDTRLSDVAKEPLPIDGLLRYGGPVEPDTLHVLHSYGDADLAAMPLMTGLYWGGDMEVLMDGARIGRFHDEQMRLFAGYSGWTAGQLEAEFDQGGWIVRPGEPDLVWATPTDALWRAAIRRLGGEYALLANFPDNPHMN
jgi:putative transcriptional regulator